jgi:hypothetical protein
MSMTRRRVTRWSSVVGLALLVACSLAGCAFTFGEDPSPESVTPKEARQQSNRMFIEEQARVERERSVFGPSFSER